MNDRVIQSYVWHDDKCFFVSTMNRKCPSPYGASYAETMVWEYDWDGRETGRLVCQDEGPSGTINTHIEVCRELKETGRLKE